MGLDGISVGQLRGTIEQPVREYSSVVSASSSSDSKAVGAMSSGRRIDPDGKNSPDHQDFEFENNNKKQDETFEEDVVKYDLSEAEKYCLDVDENDNISIIEKASGNIVQNISSKELSKYVSFLSNSTGSIVNRRY